MSKFNHYAKDLNTKANEYFKAIFAAEAELEAAEAAVKLYPKKAVLTQYDTEYEAKRLAAEARLAKAKDTKIKVNAEAARELELFYRSERTKLRNDLDNYFALNPEYLHPETMEILNSGAANANDYKRIFELAEANGNITMLRMIGSKAEEKARDESLKTEDRRIYQAITSRANQYTTDVKLSEYDSLNEVITRCVNHPSKPLIDYYNSQVVPINVEGF